MAARAMASRPAGDLSGDQVCVGGQAIFAFFIGHALVRAQQVIYRGEEFGNCCGSCSRWSRIRDFHVVLLPPVVGFWPSLVLYGHQRS
jgi:hypothetical protein